MKKIYSVYSLVSFISFVSILLTVSPLAAQNKGILPPTSAVRYYPSTSSGTQYAKAVQSPNSQFPNIQISGDQTENETTIAIDPVDPSHAICSSNDFACAGIRYFYTTNGGQTWTSNCVNIPGVQQYGWTAPFDPSVKYDSRGNAFICFGDYRSSGSGTAQNAIFVARSTDGGVTFATAVPVIADTQDVPSGGSGQQPFEDKMFIGCDANPASQYRDRIYVSWTHFAPGASYVYLSYSSDHGATWSTPAQNGIATNTLGPQGSVPVAGPDGTVYVAWSGSGFSTKPTIDLAISNSGGQFWNGGHTVDSNIRAEGVYDSVLGRMELPNKYNMRIATFPVLAVDNSNSPHKGNVYMAWQAISQQDKFPHIFFNYSTDKGVHWTDPIIIDNGNGNDVFFPAIACDPTNGNISIDYYDSRNDLTSNNGVGNNGVDIYCSVSNDGGNTFNEFRITDTTTPVTPQNQGSNGIYWGDYQGIAAYGGTTLPCWWDERTGGQYGDSHLYTALIRFGANPVSSLQGTTTCGSNSVTLTWTNPTTTALGASLGNYTITVSRNDSLLATLSQGTQTYTDQTGTGGVSYIYSVVIIDSLGNSSPATVTVAPGGALQPNGVASFSLHPVTGGIRADWTNPSQHTDGTAACDLHAIYIYSESSTTPLDSILAPTQGGNASATLTLDTTKIWHLYASAVGVRGTAYTLSDTSAHRVSFAGAPMLALHENFDPTAPLLYTTGSWGVISNASAYSKPNLLADNSTGKSNRNQSSFCQLPPFIRTALDSTLTFYHILLAGTGTTADVDLSTDNGLTWTPIAQYIQSSHATEWHDSVAASQWVQEQRDLRSHTQIGDTVSIRFRLNTAVITRAGWFIDNVNIDSTAPDYVRMPGAAPATYSLVQNYPNPFSQTTSIQFSLPVSAVTHLDVYNSLGEKVATLVSGYMNAGSYAASFDGTDLQPGVYFCSLRAGAFNTMKQMVLIK